MRRGHPFHVCAPPGGDIGVGHPMLPPRLCFSDLPAGQRLRQPACKRQSSREMQVDIRKVGVDHSHVLEAVDGLLVPPGDDLQVSQSPTNLQ